MLCKVCNEYLPSESFYNSNKVTCKKCYNQRSSRQRSIRCKQRYGRTWCNVKRSRIRDRAIKKGVPFSLKTKDIYNLFTENDKCTYCLLALDIATIDRIVPDKGYTLGNITLACFACNTIKSNRFSYEEMVNMGNTLRLLYTGKLVNKT